MKRLGQDAIVPPSACLDCGYSFDRATGIDADMPNPGDITICIDCGHVMAFADDLTTRALTDAEIIQIAGDEDVLLIQKARAKVKK